MHKNFTKTDITNVQKQTQKTVFTKSDCKKKKTVQQQTEKIHSTRHENQHIKERTFENRNTGHASPSNNVPLSLLFHIIRPLNII